MGLGFIVPAMLVGLVAVAIPPLIHLLNRRRYDVVDWGAMQFLEVSETTRRRLFIEELILMLLRMGLIALLVLAIAGPWTQWSPSTGGALSPFTENPRDVVLVLDGSGSMGLEIEEKDLKDLDSDGRKTLRDKSLLWARRFIAQLPDGSSVSIVHAGEVPRVLVQQETLPRKDERKTVDRLQVNNKILRRIGPALSLANRVIQGEPFETVELSKSVGTLIDGLDQITSDESRIAMRDSAATIRAELEGLQRQLNGGRSVPRVELRDQLENARAFFIKLPSFPAVAGTADWPMAVRRATEILGQSNQANRDVVLVGDRQKHGWADEQTLREWLALATRQKASPDKLPPRFWVAHLKTGYEDSKDPIPNWSLGPLTVDRAVVTVGKNVVFRTAVLLNGQSTDEKYKVSFSVDGVFRKEKIIEPPKDKTGKAIALKGSQELSFRHPGFAEVGAHLVTVQVIPDAVQKNPDKKRKSNDRIALDNERHFVVEVLPTIPVLIVDGGPKRNADVDAEKRKKPLDSVAILDALVFENDAQRPAFLAQVVSVQDFKASHLLEKIQPEATRTTAWLKDKLRNNAQDDELRAQIYQPPRVLILHNVPELNDEQRQAVTDFLKSGGGVFVCLGNRVDLPKYNTALYQGGKGWLPAELVDVQGKQDELETAAHPVRTSITHPALQDLVTMQELDKAKSTRWWRVTVPPNVQDAAVVARFNRNNDPWLVERFFQGGRLLLSTIPFDTSWRETITSPIGGGEAYETLMTEIVYDLARSRSARFNLSSGDPLRHRFEAKELPKNLSLQAPGQPALEVRDTSREADDYHRVEVIRERNALTIVRPELNEPGVWKLSWTDAKDKPKTAYYVVQPDPAEMNLTPIGDADRAAVKRHVPFRYESDELKLLREMEKDDKTELWWWFLLGLICLLCLEVWMTRRIVKGRAV